MPLLIAAIIIIALVVHSKESNARGGQMAGAKEKNRRKTNAPLEHSLLDTYMKYGYSFNDAFDQTYKDMIAAGYEPCIPRKAYQNREGVESSSFENGCDYAENYDSFWVQQRRKDARKEWEQSHPGISISKAPPEEIERMTYADYPTTKSAYSRDIKRSTMRMQAEPVGTFIIYPGLGTCEVLAHNWIGDGAYGGTYTLKVLRTGVIVKYVKIGDNKIMRQGR